MPTPSEKYASESSPEEGRRVERSLEQNQPERAVEQLSQQPPVPLPTSIQLPTPVAPAPVTTQQAQDDSTLPANAADEDLIEKEWVDKAKQIIAQTKDDPYQREREVNKLQSDYLMKRYSKKLGKAD